MTVQQQWEEFLSPEVLKDKILSASMMLIIYELLKDSIIGRIKDFYSTGFNVSGPIVDDSYQEQVLGLNKNILYASLEWLKSREAINNEDLLMFEQVKKARNCLAHELSLLITKALDIDVVNSFQNTFYLLNKIEIWWVVNLELATNSDYSDIEVDEDRIVPGPILSIQMMLEVLSGNSKLLEKYREVSKNKN